MSIFMVDFSISFLSRRYNQHEAEAMSPAVTSQKTRSGA